MSDDPIQNLLREADAAAAFQPPRLHPDRIEEIVRRRRMVRRSLALAVPLLLALGIGVAWHVWPARQSAPPAYAANAEVEKLKSEIAALQAEADWRAAMAARLAERQAESWQLARLRRKLAEPDALQLVREQVEYAAFAMVYQADRLARNPDLRGSARVIYRQVVSDFPRTQGAETARGRLGSE